MQEMPIDNDGDKRTHDMGSANGPWWREHGINGLARWRCSESHRLDQRAHQQGAIMNNMVDHKIETAAQLAGARSTLVAMVEM